VATVGFAAAQQAPTLSQDQMQQLQQLQQGMSSSSLGQSAMPRETILEPSAYPSAPLPISRLERLLSTRSGVALRQFGYDQLGIGRAITLPQVGAVQDDYVLGPGDEIIVSLRGQENAEYRTVVDRDGRAVLPRMNPISAAGRSLGDFRQDLTNAIHRAYVATEGFVSVGRLRQVSVLVSGEVNSPGVRTLTGLSTAADAILISGGVKKTGSLRNVQIIRGDRRITVDLYSVLTGQSGSGRAALADGDRLVVPALGPTAAIVGWVRRPAIYELGSGRRAISVRDLLSLAGGLEVRGKYRMSVLRVATDGRNQMVTLDRKSGTIQDGDILFVQPAASQTSSMATLAGGTPLAGQYAVTGTKLSEILKSPGALGNEPYTLFGMISRRDPVTLLRVLIPFTPVEVLKGSQDMNIQSDDIVRVISTKEARVLFTAVQQFRLRTQATQEALRNPLSVQQKATTPSAMINMSASTTSSSSAVQAAAENAGVGVAARQALSDSGSQASQLAPSPDSSQDYPMQQPQYPPPQAPPPGGYYPNGQYSGGTYSGSQYPGGPYPNGSYPGSSYPGGPYPEGDAMTAGSYPYGAIYPRGNQMQPGSRPFSENLQEGLSGQGEVATNLEVKGVSDLANQLRVDPLVLINFLEDRSVNVDGAVQGPGLYLVGPDADIQSVLIAAGGVVRWADKSSVEVISTSVDANNGKSQTEHRTLSLASAADAGYIVSPRDEVRVSEVFTSVGLGSVTLQGEIRHVGTYQIVRGEHLSDLLMRAGGLTESAYPYGTVFLRRSAAEREQDAFRREAKEIEDQLLIAMSRRDPQAKLSPDAFTAMQSYVTQLKNQRALGRVSVTADPAVLAANPGLDPLLEPGDVVYVPQRPYSVAVLGEVLQPGSVAFGSNMSAQDYIERAGGYSQFADKSETVLVLPDGSARRVDQSWFNFSSGDIPPGSVIYVSRDISGLDLHQIIVDTTAIVSQLAISAASLAVLSTQVK
jgi:protein involved in polysaccharide export with SLBB domain